MRNMSYINSHRSGCIGPYSEHQYSSALLQVCPTLLLDDEVATDHICDYSYYNIHNFHARISLCKMLFRPDVKGPHAGLDSRAKVSDLRA